MKRKMMAKQFWFSFLLYSTTKKTCRPTICQQHMGSHKIYRLLVPSPLAVSKEFITICCCQCDTDLTTTSDNQTWSNAVRNDDAVFLPKHKKQGFTLVCTIKLTAVNMKLSVMFCYTYYLGNLLHI